ncbi:ATP-binding protein [Sphingobacterium sp.]|uniref:sensor histidine kinase n=1 Tax=Sphingobacterium sp. TaxID=341027 RepID=UPI0031DCA847
MMLNDQFLLPILDISPLATAIYSSPDLHIAYVNKSMLETWRADSSIVGKTFCSCFPSFHKEGFSSILKNVWKTGITYTAKDTPADIVCGNQVVKRYFDFEYKALLDDNGNTYGILHSSWDVTERKLAYDIAESQNEQLIFNRKLDAFANTLSHDLKNPLSVLKLGNHFLSRNINLPQDVNQKWLENMNMAIQNIESILDKKLQLNKIRDHKPVIEYLEMDKRMMEWTEEVNLIYPNSQVNFELGKLLALRTDANAVYQIFFNLISNAIKYAAQTAHDYLHIYSEETSKGIVYYLEDNGVGIPDVNLNLEFMAHGRLHLQPDQVSGIGLPLVKELIERLGGSINISSKIGTGTVVRLFFPTMQLN